METCTKYLADFRQVKETRASGAKKILQTMYNPLILLVYKGLLTLGSLLTLTWICAVKIEPWVLIVDAAIVSLVVLELIIRVYLIGMHKFIIHVGNIIDAILAVIIVSLVMVGLFVTDERNIYLLIGLILLIVRFLVNLVWILCLYCTGETDESRTALKANLLNSGDALRFSYGHKLFTLKEEEEEKDESSDSESNYSDNSSNKQKNNV